MRQLTIDTSASLCASAIIDLKTKSIIAEKTRDIGRGHAEILMEVIGECLEESGISYSDLSKLAVTVGPGSFTGVRVGMAVAKGLKLGLALPLVGVSTLDGSIQLANEFACKTDVAAILDARRDQAYCRIKDKEPFISTYNQLADMFSSFQGSICGSGAPVLNDRLKNKLKVVHTESVTPIATIARLAASRTDAKFPAEPLYLRSADAKVQSKSIVEHQEV